MPDRSLPDPLSEPFISVPRAAAILGISRSSAYLAQEIPTVQVGGRRLVPTARFLRAFGLSS